MKNKIVLGLLMIILVFNFIFLFFYLSDENVSLEKDLETGFVTKVIDGDTVVVNGESVRLLGIDASERGEDCYKEAKERLEELVLNRDVKMEKGVKDRDHYGRLLRYIFIDNKLNEKLIENNKEREEIVSMISDDTSSDSFSIININILLVKEGLAIARFYEDKKYKNEILDAERNARENKRGCRWKVLN